MHPPSKKSPPCGDYIVQTATSSITLTPNINTNQRGVHINSCIPLPKNASVDCTLSKMAASSITLTPNINTNQRGVCFNFCIPLLKNAFTNSTNTNFILGRHSREFWWGMFRPFTQTFQKLKSSDISNTFQTPQIGGNHSKNHKFFVSWPYISKKYIHKICLKVTKIKEWKSHPCSLIPILQYLLVRKIKEWQTAQQQQTSFPWEK